jgi:cystathionine gamma-synthase
MRGFTTKAIHPLYGVGESEPVVPPIHLSTAYRYLSDEESQKGERGVSLKYSREDNPTVRVLERSLALMEGGEDALAFYSGMSALSTTILSLASKGVKVVVPLECYSTSLQLFQEMASRLGFKLVKAWPSAEKIIEAAGDNAYLVFTEVMTNPTLKVVDVMEMSKALPENTLLIVDNTFTTPILINPLKYGAGLVLHSLTKYVSGHNDVVGGGVIGSRDVIMRLWDWRKLLGTIMDPFTAYLTLRGVKTLSLRFRRASESALAIAEYLSGHRGVEEVMYPGLKESPYHDLARKIFKAHLYGGVVSFKIRGSMGDAINFLRRLRVVKPAPSLGGAESLASIPAVSASRYIPEEDRVKLGITGNLIRLAVGLEDVEDLIEDLSNALNR